MGIDFLSSLGVGGIKQNIGIGPKKHNPYFGWTQPKDTFENRSISRYTNEAALNKMILNNPKIKQIAKELDIPVVLNMSALENLMNTHAEDTKNIAVGIVSNLPFSLKNKANKQALESAAVLHDIGKVLIPEEILNKAGKLDDREQQIMHKHSELGYELLRTTDIDTRTLHLVKNHHQNAKGSGYPKVDKDFNADLNLQILSAADKYSALTEKRSYKDAFTPKEALTIIYRDVQEGKLHSFVFQALAKFAYEQMLAGAVKLGA